MRDMFKPFHPDVTRMNELILCHAICLRNCSAREAFPPWGNFSSSLDWCLSSARELCIASYRQISSVFSATDRELGNRDLTAAPLKLLLQTNTVESYLKFRLTKDISEYSGRYWCNPEDALPLTFGSRTVRVCDDLPMDISWRWYVSNIVIMKRKALYILCNIVRTSEGIILSLKILWCKILVKHSQW
jgi:hypothetical protein